MLRTEQILNAKFTPVSKGTYNADEVDAFLKVVAESYEALIGEKNELIKKISILADKIESYRNDEEAIKLSLLDAHRMAETIGKNANIKAETVIGDAETRSKLIVDGANRQSAQMIDEAREKAKEIVDNARTAVASLTERAQNETEAAITSAQKKAAEIVAQAEEEGKSIIGNSKQSFEFYSAELEKIQAETAKFKAAIEDICKGQLSLLGGIPENFIAAITAATVDSVEEETPVFEEEIAEVPAEPVEIEEAVVAEEVSEPVEEILPVQDDEEVIEEEQIVYDPEESAPESDAEEVEEVSDDDLFSLIDEAVFGDVTSPDSIPSSLDDLIPTDSVAEISEEDADDEDDVFDGFKIDLDSLGFDDDSDDNDDDEITSLFDSMFDD